MSTQLTLPKITFTQRAESALTQHDRALLGEYFSEVKSYWQQIQPNLTEVVVDPFMDREVDIRSIVVNHYVDTAADEALQYWDMMGQQLESWASGIGAPKAIEVLNLVSTNVFWKD